MTTTYVYEETEVKLTGRRAVKKNSRGTKIVSTLVEITPADPKDPVWLKWVSEASLHIVITDDNKTQILQEHDANS